jgi:hypothetical protein
MVSKALMTVVGEVIHKQHKTTKTVMTLLSLGTPETCIPPCRARVDVPNAIEISWKGFLEPKLWPFCRWCEVLGRMDTRENLCGIFRILGHQTSTNLPFPDEVPLEGLNLVHLISLTLVCVKLEGEIDWYLLCALEGSYLLHLIVVLGVLRPWDWLWSSYLGLPCWGERSLGDSLPLPSLPPSLSPFGT